jgi:CheY-like chemotaxis protein
VEDESILRMAMVHLFEEAGFEVPEAANATDAIAILEARADIRLVVTDVQMPGSMDGLRLAAAIRNRWPPIELIIVSGRVHPGAAELPARAHFLSKPYTAASLLALAHQCLGSA